MIKKFFHPNQNCTVIEPRESRFLHPSLQMVPHHANFICKQDLHIELFNKTIPRPLNE